MTTSTQPVRQSTSSEEQDWPPGKRPVMQRLRMRLMLLISLILLPLVIIALYNAWSQRRLALKGVANVAERFTRIASREQLHHIEGGRQLISVLSQMQRWRNPTNLESNIGMLDVVMRQYPIYANVVAIDPEGRILVSGNTNITSIPTNTVAWTRKIRETRAFTVGEYQWDPGLRRATLPIGYPILDRTNHQYAGAVLAFLDFSWVPNLALESQLPTNATVTIVDRSRRVLLRHPDPGERWAGSLIRDTPSDQNYRTDLEFNLFESVGLDGVKRLYSFRKLMEPPLDGEVMIGIGIPSDLAFQELRRGLATSLLTLLGAGMLSAALAWWGSGRFILARIEPLLRVARELHQGNLTARTSLPHEGDELNHLAAAVDEMASSLEQRVAERQRAEQRLRNLNEDLEQKVADRTRELKRSNEELEQFAYAASHDLQEPLRMISGHLQLLQKRYQSKLGPDADEFIHFAVDGAKRMDQLIVDLLAYSRVGTRGNPFNLVDLNDPLERALSNLALRIEEGNATVGHDRLPKVQGDAVQLTQVFQNLIANAIKFKGSKPPVVEILCEPDRESPTRYWQISVRDNGIGISPNHFQRLFQIFQRLHTREEYPGTGIGLAICKRIIERHEGRIWVESHPGEGATFCFTLPRSG